MSKNLNVFLKVCLTRRIRVVKSKIIWFENCVGFTIKKHQFYVLLTPYTICHTIKKIL